MGKEFETRSQAQVAATPEQVWAAIATGPGVSSWFVGRTEIDGDTVRTSFGDDGIPAGQVTAHDQPRHFGYRSETGADGRFVAYEYLIEGRDSAGTVLRTVTAGFLPGDDWAGEYEAMLYGTELFFATLVAYLRFFPGLAGRPVSAFGPPVTDWPGRWRRLHAALGLTDPQPGDRVRAELPGLPAVVGEVYFVNPHTLGIRTPDALYRFIRGLHGGLVAGHVLFSRTPGAQVAWQSLLQGDLP